MSINCKCGKKAIFAALYIYDRIKLKRNHNKFNVKCKTKDL